MKSPKTIKLKSLEDMEKVYRQLRDDVQAIDISGLTEDVEVLTALPDVFSTLHFVNGKLISVT